MHTYSFTRRLTNTTSNMHVISNVEAHWGVHVVKETFRALAARGRLWLTCHFAGAGTMDIGLNVLLAAIEARYGITVPHVGGTSRDLCNASQQVLCAEPNVDHVRGDIMNLLSPTDREFLLGHTCIELHVTTKDILKAIKAKCQKESKTRGRAEAKGKGKGKRQCKAKAKARGKAKVKAKGKGNAKAAKAQSKSSGSSSSSTSSSPSSSSQKAQSKSSSSSSSSDSDSEKSADQAADHGSDADDGATPAAQLVADQAADHGGGDDYGATRAANHGGAGGHDHGLDVTTRVHNLLAKSKGLHA